MLCALADDRDKVPFPEQLGICEPKLPATDSVKCLDSWLVRHCLTSFADRVDDKDVAPWLDSVSTALPLLQSVLPSAGDPQQRFRGKGIYIAACLYNNAGLLPSWMTQLVLLLRYLRQGQGVSRLFVSIYENDSKDSTPKLLGRLRKALQAEKVAHAVVTETRRDAVEPDRIDRLSYARNR